MIVAENASHTVETMWEQIFEGNASRKNIMRYVVQIAKSPELVVTSG